MDGEAAALLFLWFSSAFPLPSRSLSVIVLLVLFLCRDSESINRMNSDPRSDSPIKQAAFSPLLCLRVEIVI